MHVQLTFGVLFRCLARKKQKKKTFDRPCDQPKVDHPSALLLGTAFDPPGAKRRSCTAGGGLQPHHGAGTLLSLPISGEL